MRYFMLLCLLLSFPASAARVRVCVVGDSISEGFGSSATVFSWPKHLARLMAGTDFGVKNVADSGDKLADAELLYDTDVRGRGCTHVAILIGTNDIPDDTSGATIFAGIERMADAAAAEGAVPILITILPRGNGASWTADRQTQIEALNTLITGATSSAVPTALIVNAYDDMGASGDKKDLDASYDSGDGLHPNNAGYVRIAQLVKTAAGW